MRFGIAIVGAFAASLLAAPADAQTTTKRVIRNSDRTVIVSRGEDGRTRTRVLVQSRSFLDPGTQVFPGEVRYNDSYQAMITRPFDVLKNTPADRRYPLPDRFDLPSNNNPID
jgi:hypothetical protein